MTDPNGLAGGILIPLRGAIKKGLTYAGRAASALGKELFETGVGEAFGVPILAEKAVGLNAIGLFMYLTLSPTNSIVSESDEAAYLNGARYKSGAAGSSCNYKFPQ